MCARTAQTFRFVGISLRGCRFERKAFIAEIARSNFLFIFQTRFIPDAPNPIALKANFFDL
jgi:hypothetical protein